MNRNYQLPRKSIGAGFPFDLPSFGQRDSAALNQRGSGNRPEGGDFNLVHVRVDDHKRGKEDRWRFCAGRFEDGRWGHGGHYGRSFLYRREFRGRSNLPAVFEYSYSRVHVHTHIDTRIHTLSNDRCRMKVLCADRPGLGLEGGQRHRRKEKRITRRRGIFV